MSPLSEPHDSSSVKPDTLTPLPDERTEIVVVTPSGHALKGYPPPRRKWDRKPEDEE